MRKLFTIKYLLMLVLSATGFKQTDAQGKIVISQVYGGGGNAGATLKNDFIELFNSGNAPVNITGWSVQYASSAGTSWAVTSLSGTILAGGYYLVQEAMGTGGTTNLPTPNATGTIAMSATAGKVALVNSTTALTGTGCPFPASIIDFVGFGTAANCFETAPTPTLSNTTAALRKNNGCTDDGNNSTDFEILAPSPRNSSSPLNQCGVVSATIALGATTNAAEASTNGSFTVNFTPSTSVLTTFIYLLSGSATFNSDYSVSLNAGATPSPLTSTSGTISVPSGVSTLLITITPIDDFTTEGNETITLNISDASAGYTVVPVPATATINLNDNDLAITFIHTIQGSGATATPGTYAVEGIVTAVYPDWSPAGFYVQEEDADADSDPNTSEGIFIVQNNPTVSVGDKVKVTGTAQENGSAPSFNQGVISASSVTVISSLQTLPTPVSFTLPVNMQTDLEKYEGMLVQYNGTLTVSDNSELGNRGSLKLSAGGIVYQPTQVLDPNDAPASGTNTSGSSNVAAVISYTANNNNRTIILDDGSNAIPTSLPYVNAENTNRVGSSINNLTGILGFGFSTYRIHPVTYAVPSFSFAARPALAVLSGNLKVASFNVLNYFNGNGTGGGFPTSRGANSPAEFARQRTKIISAISQINADIVGLLELENDGTGTTSAIQDLVNGLNELMGAGTYTFINDGGTVQAFNTDEIRAGIIYKPSKVTPVGGVMTSSSNVFERPPLAHRFKLNGISMEFTYVINHFKSKSCGSATGLNLDQGDGQACWNERRKQQVNELINFFNAVVIPTSGNDRILSMGDYNAYFEEDPMDIFRAASYTVLGSSTSYSFNFQGQLGSLDHAVVSNSMLALLTGFTKWNINSTEPSYLDYNDGIRDAGESASDVNPWAGTYTPSPWRSSDHDALIASFNIPKSTDIIVTKSVPASVITGSSLTYTITVVNSGPDEAENVVLTDILPAGTTFQSFTAPAGWTATIPALGAQGTITATSATLSAGIGTQTFTLIVKAACELANNTSLSNTATVTSVTADPNANNNTATTSTMVSASTPVVTIPDAFALTSGVLPNTVYIGYAPASSLTLTSSVTGGTAPYSYSWFDGITTSMGSSITVSPTVPTTYRLTVTDANGCQGTASKYINVIDIRGGKKGDKVIICHKPQAHSNTLVIGHGGVIDHLAHGDMLGECVMVTEKSIDPLDIILNLLSIKVVPNPSSNYFNISIEGINSSQKASLKVTDLFGRTVEHRENIQNNTTIKIGNNYKPGVYIVEFIQGTTRKQFKLIKSGN